MRKDILPEDAKFIEALIKKEKREKINNEIYHLEIEKLKAEIQNFKDISNKYSAIIGILREIKSAILLGALILFLLLLSFYFK